ncbi:hypothetical protein R1T16_12280 [Flavobacterium sp. DG1-102-2]|uniref:hypothetical protein n=1 Tax=Flavobacterium sp. DG1-102-2 TaxID=3081663 RepID=UPI00294A05CA|nr:hypothetical protein [Flavobacterium sp. DG1-102-2]MDV6169204.1 hypothetical protein [Flavobacterium sp. DG1-102-2]
MKTNYLFPNKFKWISGIIFALSVTILLIWLIEPDIFKDIEIKTKVFAIAETPFMGDNVFFGIIDTNILDELLMATVIISGLVFAFSKEKIEDEMTSKIRLESLVWATYANYLIFLFCVIFIYGMIFLNIIMFAFFTHLLFFILRFNWEIYKFNRISNEE